MHIYFISKGEVRTAALAKQAVKNGHIVTISVPNTALTNESLDFTGARISKLPSLDPRIPGGYFYTLLACLAALITRPDTIVVQDWKAALIMRPLLLFLQKTCAVWVIDEIPPRFAARIASGFDQICATSRTVQYRLLTQYSVTSAYIPDGYTVPELTEISLKTIGLKKEKYAVALTQDTKEIQRIARAFAAAKTRKKLVVFGTGKSSAKVSYIDAPLTSRLATSIVRQAGIIIAADPAQSPLILQAMDAGKQIIATTDSLHEELLGVTAKYYASTDYKQLTMLIKDSFKAFLANRPGALRAKHHFTWDKAGQEYERAYRHKKTVLVPFDSIIRKESLKIAL